jgi:hypothetical protein
MHFQFIVAPPTPALLPPASPSSDSTAELLAQILDVQREQLGLMQAQAATGGDNNAARWVSFFDRWRDEFPELPNAFRDVLPQVERAYLNLMNDMVHHLREEDNRGLDDDFSLGEFLDRYAIRASQVGSILNMLGQMAEAAPRPEDGTAP